MKVRVIVPEPRSAPRGAEWAAEAVVRLLRLWRRVARATVSAHQRRAA